MHENKKLGRSGTQIFAHKNGTRRFCALSSISAIAQARVHDDGPAASADLIRSYLQVLKLSLTGELLKTDSLVPGTGNFEQLEKKTVRCSPP